MDVNVSLFQQSLEQQVDQKLKLKINNNRSTILSIKKEKECLNVSLHSFFLNAPSSILSSLASYIRGDCQRLAKGVKAFIEESLQKLDYSKDIDPKTLDVKGEVYHLQEMIDRINQEYFSGELDLLVTWYGRKKVSKKRSLTLGQYHTALKLIKMHRLLDRTCVPLYVVEFILYHEMLHHKIPPYVDEKGRNRIHNPEFKRAEKAFKYFKEAEHWMKVNTAEVFLGDSNGRT